MAQYRWKVVITEYERGFGQRDGGVKFFDDEQEAIDYTDEYNSHNTAETVPDWYMSAASPVKVQVA